VPVTEYIFVYRKFTDKLIDWNIRGTDPDILEKSKILGDYETTNVWEICPDSNPEHPAVFPVGLAERVIRYYSFIGDVVLDPFAGSGTTGLAALKLDRKFFLIEYDGDYIKVLRRSIREWMGKEATKVRTYNCESIDVSNLLF
jgi:DNA modification methylase